MHREQQTRSFIPTRSLEDFKTVAGVRTYLAHLF